MIQQDFVQDLFYTTGTFGVGRNDLTINTSNYINSTIPTVYDIQFNAPTETAGLEDTNTFVFRRGINAPV